MKCPNCGLMLGDRVTKCDCGYDFRSSQTLLHETPPVVTTALQARETPEVERGRDSSFPLIVPTYRNWPAAERGLLALDPNGISYTPVARSWAMFVIRVGMAIYAAFVLLEAFAGGFVGPVWIFVGYFGLGLLTLPFSWAVQNQAMTQEKVAKTKGLQSV